LVPVRVTSTESGPPPCAPEFWTLAGAEDHHEHRALQRPSHRRHSSSSSARTVTRADDLDQLRALGPGPMRRRRPAHHPAASCLDELSPLLLCQAAMGWTAVWGRASAVSAWYTALDRCRLRMRRASFRSCRTLCVGSSAPNRVLNREPAGYYFLNEFPAVRPPVRAGRQPRQRVLGPGERRSHHDHG
jgi:hypothetical protein